MRRIGLIVIGVCAAWGSDAQPPVLRSWVMAAPVNAAVRAIAPEVHSVRVEGEYVSVESAGLSLRSFGVLEANQYDAPLGPRTVSFRIPLHPRPAHAPVHTPLGMIGVFVTGVPLYNAVGTVSYRDQNLWHQDAVAASQNGVSPLLNALNGANDRHSPIIGFALDGYPIYGPYGDRRMRSSYRLRKMTKRDVLPDGTALTPAQEGPAVGPEFPLGTFAEDYEYVAGSGDLDEFNGRFVKTPEYPEGTYAYFLATDEGGRPAWPYLIGPRYYGEFAVMNSSARVWTDEGVTLSADREIRAGERVQLTLRFADAQGRAIRFLEK